MSQSRPNLKTIFLELSSPAPMAPTAPRLSGKGKVCGRASTIRSRIDALLLAHDAAGGFDEATSGSEATPTRHIDLERAATGGSPPSVTRARDATSTFDADETSAPLSLRPIGTPPRLDRDESVFAGPGECDVNAVRAELRGETSQFVDRWHVGIAALTGLPIFCLVFWLRKGPSTSQIRLFWQPRPRLSVGGDQGSGDTIPPIECRTAPQGRGNCALTLRYRRLAACGEFCHKPVEAVMMLQTNCHAPPWFQGPRMSLPASPSFVESLKNWSTMPGVGGIWPIVKGSLPMLSRAAANAFMWVISRVMRNCKRILRARVVREVDEPLVDDLGASLGGDVAAQIDVELAR